MIELIGVRKFFASNGVEALTGANFDLRPGEIHALVGENGAGKSTLMHVLSGNLEPSAGKVLVDGVERRFARPADALAAGIGMLRQHPRLVSGFSLWEDCVLGAEPSEFGLLAKKAARKTVAEASARWGFGLDADAAVDSLAVSQRQKAGILALLLRGVRCLILDEPTAVLAPAETEHLFTLLRSLRREGKSIVLISHKLEETLAVADRVTVLRRGRTVARRSAAEANAAELAELMFGDSESAKPSAARSVFRFDEDGPAGAEAEGGESPPSALPETALRVRGLAVAAPGRPHLRGVDLDLRKGRVLGIAGVRDSGLETLELALAGLLPISGGSIELNGVRVEGAGPGAFRAAGGTYVPADRMGMAAAPRLSIADNIAVHAHRRAKRGLPGRLGFLDRSYLRAWTATVMEAARVSADPRRNAESFSGGMLQRIITARELAEKYDMVIMAEPGWGLDAASRLQLGGRIRRIADSGRAVLLLSTDVDELVSLSDEIAILRDGEVVARLDVDRCDETGSLGSDQIASSIPELIGAAMIGTGACVDG